MERSPSSNHSNLEVFEITGILFLLGCQVTKKSRFRVHATTYRYVITQLSLADGGRCMLVADGCVGLVADRGWEGWVCMSEREIEAREPAQVPTPYSLYGKTGMQSPLAEQAVGWVGGLSWKPIPPVRLYGFKNFLVCACTVNYIVF